MTESQLNTFIEMFTDVHAVGRMYQRPSVIVEKIRKYYSITVSKSKVIESYLRRGIKIDGKTYTWVKAE